MNVAFWHHGPIQALDFYSAIIRAGGSTHRPDDGSSRDSDSYGPPQQNLEDTEAGRRPRGDAGRGLLGLPRIDPSGERCLIWPSGKGCCLCPLSDPAPTLASAPPLSAAPAGNPLAPPVTTDPYFPPGAGTAAGLGPPVAAATTPTETLTMTPERVLAPVGSEVVLRAGICDDESYLITDQRIEWLLASGNAGEIVALGGKGWCDDPLLPWNKPKKVNNQFGVGYTSPVSTTLNRGTADPSDDIPVEAGHAWASITSPVEGTSHVTAVAPRVEGWPQRRRRGPRSIGSMSSGRSPLRRSLVAVPRY